jgi:hypothetical protein
MHFCMDNAIGWELYRSFLSVLQEGSLSGAARASASRNPPQAVILPHWKKRWDLPCLRVRSLA